MTTNSAIRRSVAVTVAVIAATAVLAGCSSGTPLEKAPKPVIGHSLRPLVIYQVVPQNIPTPHPRVGRGERELPPIRGINPVIIVKKPVISLHIEYARIAPAFQGGGAWRMAILASEGTVFNGMTMRGHGYVTVIDGKTVSLFPLWELNGPVITSADVPQYLLGYDFPTEAAALTEARALTTSVTIAHCTQAQVDKGKCE